MLYTSAKCICCTAAVLYIFVAIVSQLLIGQSTEMEIIRTLDIYSWTIIRVSNYKINCVGLLLAEMNNPVVAVGLT
jgi:hypothetical protein